MIIKLNGISDVYSKNKVHNFIQKFKRKNSLVPAIKQNETPEDKREIKFNKLNNISIPIDYEEYEDFWLNVKDLIPFFSFLNF